MTTDFEDLDLLLKGFVEETLSNEQQLLLEDILASDPAAVNRYLDYVEVESMLATHRVKISNSFQQSNKSKRKSHRRKKPLKKVRKKSKNPLKFIIFAAAAALAVSAVIFYGNYHKGKDFFATVVNLQGKVQIIYKGSTKEASLEMKIPKGAQIHCPEGANSISIQSTESGLYTISSSSNVTFNRNDKGDRIKIDKGFLKANVKKQILKKQVKIITPATEMTVLGTALRTGVGKEGTFLAVDEGRVEIEIHNGTKKIIKENEIVIIGPKDINIRNTEQYRVRDLQIIKAVYGAEEKWLDVTIPIRDRAANCRLIRTGAFVGFAGDPYHKKPKSLKVTYSINGHKATAVFFEYLSDQIKQSNFQREITLPIPLAMR